MAAALAGSAKQGETAMPAIGPLELVVVLAIALLVLGPKRLPDAAEIAPPAPDGRG
jgi:hypothetical protein